MRRFFCDGGVWPLPLPELSLDLKWLCGSKVLGLGQECCNESDSLSSYEGPVFSGLELMGGARTIRLVPDIYWAVMQWHLMGRGRSLFSTVHHKG
jgi:hypothetical protein